ncbi:MC/SLC25 family protein [Legionella sp. D16C41]|uniref:MC/SLC25 family protein n=1 Tax=Legionella sp. D16C41 TaxID=3402688 RepID=UPI003AF4E0D7
MPNTEQVIPNQNFPSKNSLNLAVIISWTTLTHAYAHPFGTAFNRYQIDRTKISTWNDVSKVIFLHQHNASWATKIKSLYLSFYSAGFYKLLARTFKYGGQPIVFECLESLMNEELTTKLGDKRKPLLQATAGAAIGVLELPFLHPLDTIKLKRQIGNNIPVLELIKQERWALYNGWALAGFKNILSLSTFFGVTAATKLMLEQKEGKATFFQTLLLSSTMGAVADALVTNPLSVIKKRRQVQSNLSAFSIFKESIRNEGISVLYRGAFFKAAQSVARKALPLAATQYVVDELTHKVEPCKPR